MSATKTQRGVVSTGIGLAGGGGLELLLDINPTLPLLLGLIIILLGIFVPLPQQIDAEIERQFQSVKKSWALVLIALAEAILEALEDVKGINAIEGFPGVAFDRPPDGLAIEASAFDEPESIASRISEAFSAAGLDHVKIETKSNDIDISLTRVP